MLIEQQQKGIHYYNKDNKDNIDNTFLRSNEDNVASHSSYGVAAREEVAVATNDPNGSAILAAAMVKRAVIQLFDNGEQAAQQYKLKIRLNLTDGENPEFIAPLTKNFQNFKKYIPEQGREQVIETAREFRKDIKQQYGHFPYVGKFHLNTGKNTTHQRNVINIEPYTLAIVWFDNLNNHWRYVLSIYDFAVRGGLDSTYITAKQKYIGVKCQDLYCNPMYATTAKRPQTWAEQRSKK